MERILKSWVSHLIKMICLPAEEPGRSSLSIMMVARKQSLEADNNTNHRILGLFPLLQSLWTQWAGLALRWVHGCVFLLSLLFCGLSSWLNLHVISEGKPRARDKECLEV